MWTREKLLFITIYHQTMHRNHKLYEIVIAKSKCM